MRRAALVVVAAIVSYPALAAEAPRDAAALPAVTLFAPTAVLEADRSAHLHATDRRVRFVQPDVDALRNAMRFEAIDATIDFNLFDDARFTARRTHFRSLAPGRFIWKGDIEGFEGGRAVVAMRDDAFAAEVRIPNVGTYEMHSTSAGDYVIRHLDFLAFEPCATTHEHAWVGEAEEAPQQPEAVARGGVTPTEIDLLVGYTDDLRAALGSQASVESNIDLMIETTNDAFVDSGVPMVYRLVLAEEYDFVEVNSASSTLSSWRLVDGQADEVFADRNAVGADICALLVTNFNACGIARLMTTPSVGFASQAFNVTQFSCAIGNRTFAHECGHNSGLSHDRDNAGGSSRPYAYGYRTPDNGWRSIMAYAPGTRVPYWSSPNVFVGAMQPLGIAPGLPGEADNAQALDDNKNIIAAFRNTVIIDCIGDFNGNGSVDSGDLSILIGSWGSFDPSLDLAGDGPVGSSDLALLIGNWGPCPTE